MVSLLPTGVKNYPNKSASNAVESRFPRNLCSAARLACVKNSDRVCEMVYPWTSLDCLMQGLHLCCTVLCSVQPILADFWVTALPYPNDSLLPLPFPRTSNFVSALLELPPITAPLADPIYTTYAPSVGIGIALPSWRLYPLSRISIHPPPLPSKT